jgi:virginiamycin B lyase
MKLNKMKRTVTKIEDMWITPGPRPNGLQAAPDGLWVIDAENNHLYKLAYEDGAVLLDAPTETYKSSGITVGGGYVWVASTHNSRLYQLGEDGSTVAYYDPPGIGVHDPRDTGAAYVRPHGLEWVDGQMWVCVKPALRIYLIDPKTMKVLHSIPTPGPAPHGIAWDDGALWCADRQMKTIHKLDADSGQVLDEIHVPDPELHGLTMHEGALILCCDPSRRVCRIEL